MCSEGYVPGNWTLAMAKPDGIAFLPQIREVLESCACQPRIVMEVKIMLTEEKISLLYPKHALASYFVRVIEYLRSGECYVFVLEGEGVLNQVRAKAGSNDPALAGEDTIRGMFGKPGGHPEDPNIIHTCDSPAEFLREIKIILGDIVHFVC